MKICLFGGSFDPVHCGHIHIATEARAQVALDKVIFLPAACSPFKTGKNTLFDDTTRLAMLRKATQSLAWAEVSDLDLNLPPPSWSWRLVECYRNLLPEANLFWLMGTDQWEQLHRWARYDYLTQQLTFIVYHRAASPAPRENVRSIFIPGNHPASSSAIRQSLQNKTPLPPTWLPLGVEEIALHHLAQN